MLEEPKKEVYQANLDLVRHGLVILTWGNVSAIDRKTNLVVIKPSGVSYESMKVEDMVVVDMDGNYFGESPVIEVFSTFEGLMSAIIISQEFLLNSSQR